MALAKGELGSHYRIGWEEKRKAGKSLVEDRNIIDLPDRLPEGVKLEGHSDPGSLTGQQAPSAAAGVDSLRPALPGGRLENRMSDEAPR